MNDGALFLAVFLACAVEAVEATTIVLAAGTARNWRSALTGVLAGMVVLTVAVAFAGPAISLLPLGVLRLVVGGLLLVFGLQWVRKAVLRASGYKPLHDEEKIFHAQVAQAEAAARTSRFGVSDWFAFTLSFKGVVLEGLEVVFIVLTFGTNQRNVPLAAIAAGAAVLVIVALGIAVRAPLARVPENTMKFIVGVMLTSFGIFWGAEGAGAAWPGADISLLVIAPSVAIFALAIAGIMRFVRLSRVRHAARAETVAATEAGAAAPSASASPIPTRVKPVLARLKSFGLFWYDFVIGDDWQVAAGVAVALALTFWLSLVGGFSWILLPAVVALLLPYSIRRALR